MTLHDDPAAVGGVGLGVVPKQRRGIEVRDRLFKAAIEEFVAHGVAESRVERIVAEAGTSWGTFFRYFPRKEDVLLLASARHFRERVRPVLNAGLADESRSVYSVARELFAAVMTPPRTPELHAEMLAETQRYPQRFAAMLGEGELPVVGLVATLVVEGQRRGEIRQESPPHICATVLAAGVIFSTAQVLRAVASGQLPGTAIADVANQALEVAWAGLAAGRPLPTADGDTTASDGDTTAPDGDTTASDGDTTASDGDTTASDGEATVAA